MDFESSHTQSLSSGYNSMAKSNSGNLFYNLIDYFCDLTSNHALMLW